MDLFASKISIIGVVVPGKLGVTLLLELERRIGSEKQIYLQKYKTYGMAIIYVVLYSIQYNITILLSRKISLVN